MQLLSLLHLLVAIEARRRQLASDSHFARPKIRHHTEPPTTKKGLYNEPVPVNFNHIRKEGLVDPSTGIKEPYDALAVSMRFRIPPEEQERIKQAEKARKINQLNPWTERIDFEEPDVDLKRPKLYDLETLQTINMAIPGAYSANIAKVKSLFRTGPYMRSNQTGNISPTFDPEEVAPLDSFDKQFKDSQNWTTCDEFAVAAHFHPREVAGIVWELFYIWARGGFPDINRFDISYPTKKFVYEYKEKYDKFLDVKVDWKQPMLLLKTWMELLLVAADRRGLFIAIPKVEIPEHTRNFTSFKVQHITIRMKMVDKYLGMMICEETIGLLLAVEGEAPPFKDRPAAATLLRFRGYGTAVIPTRSENMNLKRAQKELLEAETAVLDRKQHKPKHSPFFNYDY